MDPGLIGCNQAGDECKAGSGSQITNEVNNAFQQVTNTVVIAAEVNAKVIMGHRHDIANTRNVAASLLAELANAAMLAEHMDTLAAIVAGEDAEPMDMAKARAAVNRP